MADGPLLSPAQVAEIAERWDRFVFEEAGGADGSVQVCMDIAALLASHAALGVALAEKEAARLGWWRTTENLRAEAVTLRAALDEARKALQQINECARTGYAEAAMRVGAKYDGFRDLQNIVNIARRALAGPPPTQSKDIA